jgi:hypothetical protein
MDQRLEAYRETIIKNKKDLYALCDALETQFPHHYPDLRKMLDDVQSTILVFLMDENPATAVVAYDKLIHSILFAKKNL